MPLTVKEHLEVRSNRCRLILLGDGQLDEKDCCDNLLNYGSVKNIQFTPDRRAAFVDFECEHAPLLVARCFVYRRQNPRVPFPAGVTVLLPGCSIGNFIYVSVPKFLSTAALARFFEEWSGGEVAVHRPGPAYGFNPCERAVVQLRGPLEPFADSDKLEPVSIMVNGARRVFCVVPGLPQLTDDSGIIASEGCDDCNVEALRDLMQLEEENLRRDAPQAPAEAHRQGVSRPLPSLSSLRERFETWQNHVIAVPEEKIAPWTRVFSTIDAEDVKALTPAVPSLHSLPLARFAAHCRTLGVFLAEPSVPSPEERWDDVPPCDPPTPLKTSTLRMTRDEEERESPAEERWDDVPEGAPATPLKTSTLKMTLSTREGEEKREPFLAVAANKKCPDDVSGDVEDVVVEESTVVHKLGEDEIEIYYRNLAAEMASAQCEAPVDVAVEESAVEQKPEDVSVEETAVGEEEMVEEPSERLVSGVSDVTDEKEDVEKIGEDVVVEGGKGDVEHLMRLVDEMMAGLSPSETSNDTSSSDEEEADEKEDDVSVEESDDIVVVEETEKEGKDSASPVEEPESHVVKRVEDVVVEESGEEEEEKSQIDQESSSPVEESESPADEGAEESGDDASVEEFDDVFAAVEQLTRRIDEMETAVEKLADVIVEKPDDVVVETKSHFEQLMRELKQKASIYPAAGDAAFLTAMDVEDVVDASESPADEGTEDVAVEEYGDGEEEEGEEEMEQIEQEPHEIPVDASDVIVEGSEDVTIEKLEEGGEEPANDSAPPTAALDECEDTVAAVRGDDDDVVADENEEDDDYETASEGEQEDTVDDTMSSVYYSEDEDEEEESLEGEESESASEGEGEEEGEVLDVTLFPWSVAAILDASDEASEGEVEEEEEVEKEEEKEEEEQRDNTTTAAIPPSFVVSPDRRWCQWRTAVEDVDDEEEEDEDNGGLRASMNEYDRWLTRDEGRRAKRKARGDSMCGGASSDSEEERIPLPSSLATTTWGSGIDIDEKVDTVSQGLSCLGL